MKNLNWTFLIFSFVAAVVVLYFVFINQEGATQKLAIQNALGGGIGMVLGLIVWNRIGKKNDDTFDLDDK